MRNARAMTRLLLAGMIVGFGLTLWSAGSAGACDPSMGCGGGDGMTTSPPQTSPPQTHGTPSVTSNKSSNSGSSHSTQPPVLRTTPPTARRTPVTQPRRSVQPQIAQAPVEDFVPPTAESSAVQPGPAIALYGDPPPGGAGTAAASPLPPAPAEGSGATKVLWAFGIGVGAVGIGIGAATTLKSGAGLAAGGSTLEPVA